MTKRKPKVTLDVETRSTHPLSGPFRWETDTPIISVLSDGTVLEYKTDVVSDEGNTQIEFYSKMMALDNEHWHVDEARDDRKGRTPMERAKHIVDHYGTFFDDAMPLPFEETEMMRRGTEIHKMIEQCHADIAKITHVDLGLSGVDYRALELRIAAHAMQAIIGNEIAKMWADEAYMPTVAEHALGLVKHDPLKALDSGKKPAKTLMDTTAIKPIGNS